MTLLQIVHWLAALVVLAEALNKLERAAPCRQGLGWRDRTTEWLKAAAWWMLAIGGAGALVSPFMVHITIHRHAAQYLPLLMPLQTPTLQDVLIVLGVAVLIVRTRIKEGD